MSASALTHAVRLTGHDPAVYRCHALHDRERSYPESNCYTDVLIELLHGCGYEPLAVLGSLVRLDFEGDQWTFFKPPPEDLEHLYGIDVHEMQPYRPLPDQIGEQLALGRTLIVELDAWYLPDTAATSYRHEHVKTSVAMEAIEPDAQTLRYFHGPGLFECRGEDYRGALRIGGPPGPEVLPPYTELVRFDAGHPVPAAELPGVARELLARHLHRRPPGNPFLRYGEHLSTRLPTLLAASLEEYHAYAFATVRMAGAAFELLADHATFALGTAAAPVAGALHELVAGCKALSFRLGRRKPFDAEAALGPLAAAWELAFSGLEEALA